jgi:hypothetical protein
MFKKYYFSFIYFSIFFILYNNSFGKDVRIYPIEKNLEQELDNPESLVYIYDFISPLKFKLKDLNVQKFEKYKSIKKKKIEIVEKQTETFVSAVEDRNYDPEIENPRVYFKKTFRTKYYEIVIGHENFLAEIDFDSKKLLQIQRIDHSGKYEVNFYIHYNPERLERDLFLYYIIEDYPERTGWEYVSHVEVSRKVYYYKNEDAKDSNGNEKDKERAYNLAHRLQNVIYALMEEHYKCPDDSLKGKIEVDSLKIGLNEALEKFSHVKDSLRFNKKNDRSVSNWNLRLLYIVSSEDGYSGSKLITLNGANEYLAEELEKFLLPVIDKYVKLERLQYKFCMPANYKKTIQIYFEKGKVIKIEV